MPRSILAVLLLILPVALIGCKSTPPPPTDPNDPIDWYANRDKPGPNAPDNSSWTDVFVDDEDEAFDVSDWLASPAGFFPIAMPITEPAVGVGLGGGLIFFHHREDNPDGSANRTPPSMSFVGGGGTSNGSWGAGAGHLGVWDEDNIRYLGVLGAFDVNLKFYGLGGSGSANKSVNLDMNGGAVIQDLKFRIPDTDLFLGFNYTFLKLESSFGTEKPIPGVDEREFNSKTAGLGTGLLYDTRDNIFTPNQGILSELELIWSNELVGGDFNFMEYRWTNVGWFPVHRQLVLGLRLDLAYAGNDAPFYKLPFIQLRGVPVGRYMGNAAITAEIEPRLNLTDRWAVVAFTGAASAAESFSDLNDAKLIVTYGGGIRYLIARKLGIYFGLDYARGPETDAIYVTFGTAWLR